MSRKVLSFHQNLHRATMKKYREAPEWIIAVLVVGNTDAENWTENDG
jgi:hypothetical protein